MHYNKCIIHLRMYGQALYSHFLNVTHISVNCIIKIFIYFEMNIRISQIVDTCEYEYLAMNSQNLIFVCALIIHFS